MGLMVFKSFSVVMQRFNGRTAECLLIVEINKTLSASCKGSDHFFGSFAKVRVETRENFHSTRRKLSLKIALLLDGLIPDNKSRSITRVQRVFLTNSF